MEVLAGVLLGGIVGVVGEEEEPRREVKFEGERKFFFLCSFFSGETVRVGCCCSRQVKSSKDSPSVV